MKIVIIANNSNGLYLFRRHLMSTMIAQGHKVIALTPFDTDIDSLRNLGIELINTPIDRRGTNPFKDYYLLKLYKKELKRINPDLVITYTIKPNVYGGLACKQLHIPYAANITGLGTAFERKGFLRKAAIVMNSIALKKAKIVFFENSENRDIFIKEGIINRNRTHVLHGAGVNLDHFTYQPYPNNEEFVFLFVGRVMKEKGIDELLESMERLIDNNVPCILNILGNYEEDYKAIIDEKAKNGWLNYYGFQHDVRPFISDCDCFVLPSYHEGMANTNLECASSGRPIITSNISGCREAVVDGSGFLCEPRNVDSLYDAMKRIVEISRNQREQMGLKGRKHMGEMFDKDKVVAETLCFLFDNSVRN